MMKSQQEHSVPSGAYDEERLPFDHVLRKLVNTKPTRKTAAEPVKRNAKNPTKRV